MRVGAMAVLLLVLLGSGGHRASGPGPATERARFAVLGEAVVDYSHPVPGAVIRRFEPPPTPYAAGHRGVDLAAAAGTPVRAAGRGVVRFAGPVAGRGVVVVAHPDGISTEYEPVRPLVRAGDAVAGGQVVGVVAGRHAGCPGSCLHWGARRGADYLDPLALLHALGPVVLLPWPRPAG